MNRDASSRGNWVIGGGTTGIVAVFSSDLRRAVETAEIAFDDTELPLLLDWRLRECDYGDLNGKSVEETHRKKQERGDLPYPRGES